MIGAIEALTVGTNDADWPNIWPIIRDHPEFGRSLIGSISYGHTGTADFLLQKLTEEQLGELYAWLLVNYPPSSLDHGNHRPLSQPRAHHFFATTACNARLSSSSSATVCLSWWFSSSSCRSRFASLTSIPPYFPFQR